MGEAIYVEEDFDFLAQAYRKGFTSTLSLI